MLQFDNFICIIYMWASITICPKNTIEWYIRLQECASFFFALKSLINMTVAQKMKTVLLI